MDTSHEFDWNIPTRTIFGAGSLDKIAELKPLGKKAVIVISNGKLVRANGALERVKNGLLKAGADAAIFDKIQANPNLENIESGAKFARENKCDFVVALGGGSVIDAAKSIAAMATNDGELWEYMRGVYPERFVRMAQAMGIKNANKPEDFICALKKLKADCGVDDLKMSDYAIVRGDFAKFVENARLTMPVLFAADTKALSDAECIEIFEKSYR